MNTIQITQLTPEQLDQRIANALRTELEEFKKELNSPPQREEYLSRKEVGGLFGVPMSTLHNWCKKGRLQPYGIGNRVYFLRSDIEKALKPLKQ